MATRLRGSGLAEGGGVRSRPAASPRSPHAPTRPPLPGRVRARGGPGARPAVPPRAVRGHAAAHRAEEPSVQSPAGPHGGRPAAGEQRPQPPGHSPSPRHCHPPLGRQAFGHGGCRAAPGGGGWSLGGVDPRADVRSTGLSVPSPSDRERLKSTGVLEAAPDPDCPGDRLVTGGSSGGRKHRVVG